MTAPRRSRRAMLLACGAVVAVAAPRAALAAASLPERRFAVLELRGEASAALRSALGDRARAAALEESQATRWVVMTPESIALILNENGAACGEEECEVATARSVGADLVLGGEVRRLGKLHALDLQVHETQRGNLVAAGNVEAASEIDLLRAGADLAARVIRTAFASAGAVGTQTAGTGPVCAGPAWTCLVPGPCPDGPLRGRVCAPGSVPETGPAAAPKAGAQATAALCRAVRRRLTELAVRAGDVDARIDEELGRIEQECAETAVVSALWTDAPAGRTHALSVLPSRSLARGMDRLRLVRVSAPERDGGTRAASAAVQPGAQASRAVPPKGTAASSDRSEIGQRARAVVEAWEREGAR